MALETVPISDVAAESAISGQTSRSHNHKLYHIYYYRIPTIWHTGMDGEADLRGARIRVFEPIREALRGYRFKVANALLL
jgi:hypothetical protein